MKKPKTSNIFRGSAVIKKLFWFLRKQEKPQITWWSSVDGLEKVAPILPAKEFIPDWFKNIERSEDSTPITKGTVKVCPSFPEFFAQGYVVPLWCDLQINVGAEGFEWHTSDKKFSFEIHGNNQFRDHVPEHVRKNSSLVLKTVCPWRVKTSPGYSLWQMPMYYNYNSLFEVLPGIIWSDILHEINQQMLIKKYGIFTISRGTPLAVYIPYKREKYDFTIRKNDDETRGWADESVLHVHSKFHGGYKLMQLESKKCPVNKKD